MKRNIFFREDNLLTAIGKGMSDRLISCLHCLARIATGHPYMVHKCYPCKDVGTRQPLAYSIDSTVTSLNSDMKLRRWL